jgi:hypothetical protein
VIHPRGNQVTTSGKRAAANPLKPEARLNNISELSPCRKENTGLYRYKN